MIEYAHRHEIRAGYAVGIAIGLTLGTAIGAYIAGRLPDLALERFFGVVLALLAIKFLAFPTVVHDAVHRRN
ncbi:sulfite exporter TauE/SafE family protein [Nocardia terrae]|uniref:sulfite exporter TauE/SafE family protein n=1 Tax=Nocardia terrae TaxID=2675851 RepID=UPI0018DFFDBD|nr:sulfite exporter TauE/SafE family protein [Nocardia terrae]